MKLRELLERPTRARVCIRGRLPPLSLPLPASSSCIRATSIRIWCARGEVRRLRKFCAYRDTVFARRLFVPPREPPVLCDKPPSHARSILGDHRIQPRGRRAPLLLLLLAFPPTDFQSLRSYNLRISIGGRFSTVSFRRVWKFRYSLPRRGDEIIWNYREIKAGRGRCK